MPPLLAWLSRMLRTGTASPAVGLPVPGRRTDAIRDTVRFLAWLDPIRKAEGLGPVAMHPDLIDDARENNRLQLRHGLGHYAMGRASRQNVAQAPLESLPTLWMGSPSHRANLLAPGVRYVGLAGTDAGDLWTLNLL